MSAVTICHPFQELKELTHDRYRGSTGTKQQRARRMTKRRDWDDFMGLMLESSKGLPGEDLWIEAVQLLAESCVRLQDRLGEEDLAELVGLGALMVRQAKREMQAGRMTGDLFAKIRKVK